MWRRILRILGWLVAAGWLYLALLGLDVYWNIATWQPRWDGPAWVSIASILIGIASLSLLSISILSNLERGLALVLCLGLAALSVYVFPAEPLSDGLFGRQASSPAWYRGLRLLVMWLPFLFWCRAIRASRIHNSGKETAIQSDTFKPGETRR